MGSGGPVSTDLPNHCNWGSSSTTACPIQHSLQFGHFSATSCSPPTKGHLFTLNTTYPCYHQPITLQIQSAPGSGPAEMVSWEPSWKHTFLQLSHRWGQDHPNSYPSPSQLASFPPVNTLFALAPHTQYIHLQPKFLITKNTTPSKFHTTANTPAPGHTRSSCYLHSPPITVTGKTVSTQGILLALNYCQLTDN